MTGNIQEAFDYLTEQLNEQINEALAQIHQRLVALERDNAALRAELGSRQAFIKRITGREN